jgi:CDP-4-dehydro-6-deoxyglucose reductase
MTSYNINIQPSGQQFQVEAGKIILDAALEQGIAFPYGCRGGACGSCLGDIQAGKVTYPDGLPMALGEDDIAEGKALFCQAVAESDLTIHMAEIKSDTEIEIKTLPARVESLRKLSHDVMEMQLKLPASENLAFFAGQYIDFLLQGGRKRSFSLANAPIEDNYLSLHLRHVKGGYFTDHVFNAMREKDLVRIEGPHGSFYLRTDEESKQRPLILMAGGTGFAPLKAMIEHMLSEEVDRPVYLYWGVRTQTDLYQNDLAEKWAFQYENIHYIPVLSDADDDTNWQGRTGFVHQAIADDFSDLSTFSVYMSGPPPMINAAKTAFMQQGLENEQLYSDSFDYSTDALKAMAD